MFSAIIHFCDFVNNLLRILFLYSILHFQALRKVSTTSSAGGLVLPFQGALHFRLKAV